MELGKDFKRVVQGCLKGGGGCPLILNGCKANGIRRINLKFRTIILYTYTVQCFSHPLGLFDSENLDLIRLRRNEASYL